MQGGSLLENEMFSSFFFTFLTIKKVKKKTYEKNIPLKSMSIADKKRQDTIFKFKNKIKYDKYWFFLTKIIFQNRNK